MTEAIIALASFASAAILYPFLIRYLNQREHAQSVSEYSLESFKSKKRTPSLGGVLFIAIPIFVTMVADPLFFKSTNTLLVVLTFLGYGLIGFADDVKIIIERNNKGLSASFKFMLQLILALVFFWFYAQEISTSVAIPFTSFNLELGIFYSVLVLFMFTGASNAVNLTDGMDGLAGGTSLLALIPFAVFAYLAQEMGILYFIIALIGALIAYLLYNRHPAKIIMGDTGALALGGVLAALALVLKQEIALILIGGVFVFETLCVILQIGSVKLRKKRIFRYTPIHYSFTLAGWKETNVVYFFWGLGLIGMVLGLLAGLNK